MNKNLIIIIILLIGTVTITGCIDTGRMTEDEYIDFLDLYEDRLKDMQTDNMYEYDSLMYGDLSSSEFVINEEARKKEYEEILSAYENIIPPLRYEEAHFHLKQALNYNILKSQSLIQGVKFQDNAAISQADRYRRLYVQSMDRVIDAWPV